MRKIQSFKNPPNKSTIVKNLKGDIHFIDSFSIELDNTENHSIDYLTALLFTSVPGWANALMKLRDTIVKPFGLATGMIPEQQYLDPTLNFEIGEKAIFFTVIEKSENEIVMAENDKHLYFRTSLFTESINDESKLLAYLTTIVQFHNKLGEIYFVPVKPFHKLMMKSILSQFSKAV